MTEQSLDLAAAHRHFSAACFNGVWNLIDKANRVAEDDRLMETMAHASLYHWLQRSDCSTRNLSISYWLLSRVYALQKRTDQALSYARLCLNHSGHEGPFYLGYAYEALARASAVSGDDVAANEMLLKAKEQAEQVDDEGERNLLTGDLATVMPGTSGQGL